MDKTKKIRLVSISIILAIVLIAMSLATVYAVLFSSYVPIDSQITVHVIGADATNISIQLGENQDLVFNSPGDRIDFTMQLQNESSEIFHYYYKLSVTEESTGLQDAVMVYLDDSFLGSLGELCSGGQAVIDENLYILGGTAENPAIKDHVLSFELHNAAADTYYADKTVKISIDSYAKTPDFRTDIFVTNETDFYNAVNDINYGGVPFIVRLCSDITLSANYEIKNPCSIDLMGNELIFNGHYLTLTQDGTVTLFTSDSVDYSALTESTGGFQLNGSGAVLDINEFSYTSPENAVTDIAALYSAKVLITQCDQTAAAELVSTRFGEKVGSGILRGNSVSVFGALDFYGSSGAVTVGGIQLQEYSYDAATRILTAPEAPAVLDTGDGARTYPTEITVGGHVINFQIIGTGDYAVLNSILENELQHIPDGSAEVSYDLFLPTLLQNRNASIEWRSSDEELIKSDGTIGETAQGEVTLVATIRINQSVFSKIFTFEVYRQDNEMKFQYLLALLNPILLSEVYNAEGSVYALPVVDSASDNDYRATVTGGNDLGLTNLEYSVQSAYYYMTVADEDSDGYLNDLYLTQATFQSYATVDVRGYFDSEYYDGTIGVQIELGNNTDLVRTVFNYVQGELNEINVLQNIIDTRVLYGMANEKGDFTMPTKYMGYDIDYSIPTVQNRLQLVVDLYTEDDADYTALISWATGATASVRADAVVPTIDASVAGYESDGNATVSADEEQTILKYAADRGYSEYAANWANYITSAQRSLAYDFANGIITNIVYNENTCVISLSTLNFYNIDTNIPIDVSVHMQETEIDKETRELTFSTPATLRADNNGFGDSDVFRSVKLQVWQQLPVDERSGLPISGETIIYGDSDIWKYILVRDAKLCTTLTFENGSEEDKFYALLGWAESVSNSGQTAEEVVPTIDQTVADNSSDGHVFISDDEAEAITNLGGIFSSESDVFKFADAWGIALEDVYYLPPEAKTALISAVNTQAGTFELVYSTDNITEFLNWATSTTEYGWWIFTHYAYYSNCDITLSSNSSTVCDGNITISQDEANKIKNTWINDFGFIAFESAWDAVVTQYPYTVSSISDLATALTEAYQEIIGNDFEDLISWATATGTSEAASSISESVNYFSQYGANNSDTKETVSAAEKQAIDEFISVAFLGAYSTDFQTLWTANAQEKQSYNTSVTYVDKNGNVVQENGVNLTGTGKEYLVYFVNSLLPAENVETLLDSGETVPVGMDAVLSQDIQEKIGSCYWYTGATTANYTQNNAYRLLYSEGVYSFENLGATLASSDEDMASALSSATSGNIGDLYLFQGGSTANYEYGYLYAVSYDASNENYRFEQYCKPCAVEDYGGTRPLYHTYVSSMNGALGGIARFINLNEVQVIGSSDDNMHIFETCNAQTFLGLLTLNSPNITKLYLNYCSLNNISNLAKLENLKQLSLLGNGYLTNINVLQKLNINDLSYLDLSGIGFTADSYKYYISQFAVIYASYSDAHAAAPEIYTDYAYDSVTDFSTKIGKNLFSVTLTDNEKTALKYLYYMKSIEQMKSSKLQVPAYIYIDLSNNTCPVTWAVADGGGILSVYTRSDGGTVYQIFEKTGSGTAVISATVTVNGESYTRYYILTLTS